MNQYEEREITMVLNAVAEGKADRTDDLLPLVYQELKRLAGSKLSAERSDHTLQPTALVNEAYLRLAESIDKRWENRAHFFGAAAEAMRRILVDHARRRNRVKRGGKDHQRVHFDNLDHIEKSRPAELLKLDDALMDLAENEPKLAELVKLKFFTGLSTHQAGELLGVSPRTAERHWSFARAWLYREMGLETKEDEQGDQDPDR